MPEEKLWHLNEDSMKKIILILCSFYSLSSVAIQEGDLNINGGIGVFGSRGVLGVSADKFITQNHALTFAVGIDFVGATSLIGYKYFGEKINVSNTIWDKCLFLFECDKHLYIGSSIQYASTSTLKIAEGTDEREYKLDPKWLELISVGSRHVFKNNMTLDIEISYRSIVAGGQATQTVGSPADDTHSIKMGYHNVGFNLGLGYLF